MKKIVAGFVAGLAVFLLGASNAQAFVIKTGEDVTVAKGEIIDETLLVVGQSVTIDADVNGDIFCAGQTVTVNGKVNGDVICAGQTIVIANAVAGSVRAIGQTVQINGDVSRNVTVVGQNLTERSNIAGEMLFAGQRASIDGQIMKNVVGAGGFVAVNGKINGNAQFANDNLILGKNAAIGGSLVYTSKNDAVLEDGSMIVGGVTRHQPAPEKIKAKEHRQKTNEEMVSDKIIGLAMNLAVALLLILFLRKPVAKITNAMLAKPGRSFAWGLLFIVLTPIAAIMFLVTIIGIPVALLVALFYVLALYLARIFAAIAVGKMITQNYWKSKQESLLAATVIGVIVAWLLFAIPVAGFILGAAFVVWGFGGIYYLFRK